MIGAVIGDIIGSFYELNNTKNKNFKLFTPSSKFTDDTILTIAVADALLEYGQIKKNIFLNTNKQKLFTGKLKHWGRRFPSAGYGEMFNEWLISGNSKPYNSYANGAAMRVSPIGFAFNSLNDVLKEAEFSSKLTHNHPKGIKGAKAIAASIYIARTGGAKQDIKYFIEKEIKYNVSFKLDEIRAGYQFDTSAEGSVPQAIVSFLESNDFEDALRNAVSLGGDSDTIACMTGGIAEAFYKKIPNDIINFAKLRMDISIIGIIEKFNKQFNVDNYLN